MSARNFDNVTAPDPILCRICGKNIFYKKRADYDKVLEENEINKYPGLLRWRLYELDRHEKCDQEHERLEKLEAERKQKAYLADLEKRKAEILDYLLTNPAFPHGFQFKDFSKCNVDDGNRAAIQYLSNWKCGDRFGFFLHGPVGSGKSHLLQCLANKIIRIDPMFGEHEFKPRIGWTTAASLLFHIKGEFNEKRQFILSDAIKVPYLFLDDLGVENATDWAKEQLFLLLDERLSKRLCTFISSNLSLDEIRDRLSERISSRIKEMCVVLKVTSKDFRTDVMKANVETLKQRQKGEQRELS